MSTLELPLFPLNTVLFPGGVLPLRIFEPRYLAMVSECLKTESGFAVVAIQNGSEAGEPAAFNPLGTIAHIVDFDRLDDGTLGITCRGGGRLTVTDHQVRSDRLILGRAELQQPETTQPVTAGHRPLAQFLHELLERDDVQPYRRWLDENWASASWIGFRLAELLPLPLQVKYHLLEVADAEQRLAVLDRILRDNRLL